jgi:hypothetical protein
VGGSGGGRKVAEGVGGGWEAGVGGGTLSSASQGRKGCSSARTVPSACRPCVPGMDLVHRAEREGRHAGPRRAPGLRGAFQGEIY